MKFDWFDTVVAGILVSYLGGIGVAFIFATYVIIIYSEFHHLTVIKED